MTVDYRAGVKTGMTTVTLVTSVDHLIAPKLQSKRETSLDFKVTVTSLYFNDFICRSHFIWKADTANKDSFAVVSDRIST